MNRGDLRFFHLPGVDLYQAGPGFPTPENTVAIRHRVRGGYLCPSYRDVDGYGLCITTDRAHAHHYRPEDVAAVLAWLGPEWCADF